VFRRSREIKESLTRTRKGFFGQIMGLLGANEVTDELWEELEELLILADVGVNTTVELVERLQERVVKERIHRADGVTALLKEELLAILNGSSRPLAMEEKRLLTVILIVGANGSGKTTSIAKLAHYFQRQGRKVLLAAADTFRAAAVDQLKVWGRRVGAEVIAHTPGADPGAVVYDAIRASQSRGIDLLIVDTAGRLHTKYNLVGTAHSLRWHW